MELEPPRARPPAPEPILAAHDVTIAYGERRIVTGADLSIAGGERVALVGPNGAGKSSLLRAMTGVLRPTVGEVRLCGAPIATVDTPVVSSAATSVVFRPTRSPK